jgi:hypothetical protein
MTEKPAAVSYSNIDEDIDQDDGGRETRPIHFDLSWLTNLAWAIAKRAEPSVAAAPLDDPPVWWLDEGRAKPVERRRRGRKRR